MLFGFNNTKELTLELNCDVHQICIQADIFAREILTHRSKFDLKRILGPFQVDWLRLLHEAYVYDRIKCIYYGIQSFNLLKIPEGTYSFPGNVILMHLLVKKTFQFSTGDQQNYALYVDLKYKKLQEILDPIFELYPDLREGMSDDINIVSYVNVVSESILKGLNNAKEFLKSKSKNGDSSLFEIIPMNSSDIDKFLIEDSNPVINSFLSKDGKKFFFILPYDKSSNDALRFNESLFLSRALGITSTQLYEGDNPFYKVANRDNLSDPFAREEVYAVTGLKSEIVPLSQARISEYLGINSFKAEIMKVKESGDDNQTP